LQSVQDRLRGPHSPLFNDQEGSGNKNTNWRWWLDSRTETAYSD